MKKLITKSIIVSLLFLGVSIQLRAQCSFSGLASAYCRNGAAASLTASVPGGIFSGPGISGSVFTPSVAGAGTHTITYAICTTSYNVTSGTHSLITPIGTAALTGFSSYDDVTSSSSLAIGFPFQFFCNTYDGFWLCSNGWISFSQTALTTYPGQNMPTGTTPYNMIAACWVDLNLNNGGSITYTTVGTQPNRICAITWSQVPHYTGGNPVTVQIQLYEGSNKIEIHTATMPGNGTSHTQGIQNNNSSIAYVVPGRNANSSWTATNDMYRFEPINNCITSQTTTVDATNLTIAGPSTLCLHSSAMLTAGGTTSYTWNTTENTAAVTVTPGSTSVYTVSGTGSGNLACVYNTTHTITVFSTPLGGNTNPPLLCVGSTATLTGTGASTYTWSTSEQTNTIEVMPNVTTTYTLWGTSNLGCEEQITVTQNVNTNVLSISPNTSVCLGSPATLTVTGGSTYSWSTVPSSPFSMITVTPNAMTVYSVAATDANFCYLEAFVTVSVNPKPTISLNTPKTVVCKGDKVVFTAGGGDTYQWSHGTATGNTISVIPAVDIPLTVTVTGTNQYGCSNKNQITITVERCQGINELSGAMSLVGIYPNPSTGIFNLKKTSLIATKAEVFNSVGAHIATLELNDEVTVLDLSGHAAGVYFVKVSGKSGVSQVTRIISE